MGGAQGSNMETIPEPSSATQNNPAANKRKQLPSEERQQRQNPHRDGPNGGGKRAESRESQAIRASITREVTTSKPLPAPAQGN